MKLGLACPRIAGACGAQQVSRQRIDFGYGIVSGHQMPARGFVTRTLGELLNRSPTLARGWGVTGSGAGGVGLEVARLPRQAARGGFVIVTCLNFCAMLGGLLG